MAIIQDTKLDALYVELTDLHIKEFKAWDDDIRRPLLDRIHELYEEISKRREFLRDNTDEQTKLI